MATTPKRKRGTTRADNQASSDDLLKYYREMLLIRRFEEKAGQLYGMGLIGGFCHLYIGQEAVVVGMQAAASDEDGVITSYRDHGHMLATGMDAAGVMAELTGREGGYSQGKGGSMHMFSKEKNFYGGHGIVGAQVPLGTGIAFSYKYREEKKVCMTYLGDGAVNQGQVYEAFNMAALWHLPVIYCIENNQYAMGTSTQRHSSSPDLYERARPMAFPVNRLMVWMFWRSRLLVNVLWNIAVQARGHTSLNLKPIAIAGIPCPTRRNTVPRTSSTRCVKSTIRLTWSKNF